MMISHKPKTTLLYVALVMAAVIPAAFAMKSWQSAALAPPEPAAFQPVESIEVTPTEIKPPAQNRRSNAQQMLFREWILKEPTAGQIQKVMIRYADLHPEKIQRWRTQARLRALIPKFSMGTDYSRGNNIDLDRGSTSEPDVYIFGPDEEDQGWDADVSWELGDLIWSSDQNSIEYRNKQLNDQRQYILTEGMRIYFERRRAQIDTIYNPAASRKDHYDKLVRIDEFTALLDILTGGYMSRQMDKMIQGAPKLSKLWIYQENPVNDSQNNQAPLPDFR